MFLVSVVGLAGLAAGYALWFETLEIHGTVNTGSLDIGLSHNPITGITENDHGKDVAECSASLSTGGNGEPNGALMITIDTGYPSYECWITFDVHSNGTIPVHIHQPEFNGPNIDVGVDIDVDVVNCYAQDTQLHEGNQAWCTIRVHVLQPAPELGQLSFWFDVFGHQFNLAEGGFHEE